MGSARVGSNPAAVVLLLRAHTFFLLRPLAARPRGAWTTDAHRGDALAEWLRRSPAK